MAEIVARNGNELTLQVTVKLTSSLLEMENTILDTHRKKLTDWLGCYRGRLQNFG